MLRQECWSFYTLWFWPSHMLVWRLLGMNHWLDAACPLRKLLWFLPYSGRFHLKATLSCHWSTCIPAGGHLLLGFCLCWDLQPCSLTYALHALTTILRVTMNLPQKFTYHRRASCQSHNEFATGKLLQKFTCIHYHHHASCHSNSELAAEAIVRNCQQHACSQSFGTLKLYSTNTMFMLLDVCQLCL